MCLVFFPIRFKSSAQADLESSMCVNISYKQRFTLQRPVSQLSFNLIQKHLPFDSAIDIAIGWLLVFEIANAK